MMIEAKKLIGIPIAAEDALRRIGTIKQLVIDPENGQILGFLVSTGLFNQPKTISLMDIKYWDMNGLVTEYEENLLPIEEIVRIKEIIDKGIDFLDMSAATEDGKNLGKVEDLLVDTETGLVVKYYLRDLLGKSRILTHDKVIKVDKKIIFADDIGEISSTIIGTQII